MVHDDRALQPHEPQADAEGGAAVAEEDLKVLVVDDEAAVLHHLTDGLALLGFRTCSAGSVAAALDCLAQDPAIGVVMTDIRMPGRDGLSLTQEILGGRRSSSPVQVILITGHATFEDATSALRAGARDMLRKPFRLAEAGAAVADALKAARAERRALLGRAREAQRIAELEALRKDLAGRLHAALVKSNLLLREAAGSGQADVEALCDALRAPFGLITEGAAMVAGETPNPLDTGIACLRGGVQDAMRVIELVERFCRLECRPSEQAVEDFDLAALAGGAVTAARPRAAERDVQLGAVASPPLPVTSLRATAEEILVQAICAALEWAPPRCAVAVEAASCRAEGRDWAVVTVLAATPGAGLRPPLAPALEAAEDAQSGMQEGLHLMMARRLATRIGGLLTTWSQGTDALAIRIALPA